MMKEVHGLDELNKIISSCRRAAVGFYSPVCLPCKKIAPYFKEFSEKYPEICFLRVNVLDESNKSALEFFSICGPTLMFFEDGKEVERLEVEKYELDEIIKKFRRFVEG